MLVKCSGTTTATGLVLALALYPLPELLFTGLGSSISRWYVLCHLLNGARGCLVPAPPCGSGFRDLLPLLVCPFDTGVP